MWRPSADRSQTRYLNFFILKHVILILLVFYLETGAKMPPRDTIHHFLIGQNDDVVVAAVVVVLCCFSNSTKREIKKELKS